MVHSIISFSKYQLKVVLIPLFGLHCRQSQVFLLNIQQECSRVEHENTLNNVTYRTVRNLS
jgi:hypothetical protein